MDALFRIGARGSPLSLAQTHQVQARLAAALGVGIERLPIEPITTTGDRIQDRTLSEAGGKGLFTKEIDDAMLAGRIDLAVHSLKDLPTRMPNGLALASTPEREDPRDAFISREGAKLIDLPMGAHLGTASLRRQAQALHIRPDLKVTPLRGNVATRIAKLQAGDVDATFLAMAGLRRLGLQDKISGIVDPEESPPAVCQGTLAITARSDDVRMLEILASMENATARLEAEAERGVLEALDGSCRTPIAAFARAGDGKLRLLAETLTIDGKTRWRRAGEITAPTKESARALGLKLGGEIKAEAGPLLYQS